MEIKLEIISQVTPAIILGLNIKSLKKEAVLCGLLVGVGVTVGLMFANWEGLIPNERPWGFHAGLWGLLANLITIGTFSLFVKSEREKLNPEKL